LRGERVGDNPWDGDTLEWATSSPPPAYNYAVIPTVSSAYPMWDKPDRNRDAARLERGEGIFARGHATPVSSVQDGRLEEVMAMPPHSLWPALVGVTLFAGFVMLLLSHFLIAAAVGGVLVLLLVAWHSYEPEHRPPAGAATGMPAGVWGTSLFLSSEAMLFAGVIASYFYLNFRAVRWPPPGIALPDTLDPSILTAVLVASSIPMWLAARHARRGELRQTVATIALATFVQSGYLAFQLHQLVAELHMLHPQQSAYASIYVALLGLHHAHVLVGVLLDLGLLFWLIRSNLSGYRVTGVRALAIYWYVVSALAVAVLLTQLSPAL
jgi:cytochrome c oxidase subunit I+III